MAIRSSSPRAPAAGRWPSRASRRSPRRRPRGACSRRTKTGGRNQHGRITTRHRGGGHKHRYRLDRLPARQGRRAREGRRASSTTRTGRRGSRCSTTRTARRRTSSRPSASGSATTVESGPGADIKAGQRAAARVDPDGHRRPQRRAAPRAGRQDGALGRLGRPLVAKDGGYAVLRLPSGEMRRVPLACRATVGMVGNADHANESSGKAGRSRWLGKRPTVRGIGHEPGRPPARRRRGQVQGRAPPGDAVGRATRGKRTRRKHKESDKLIVRGRRRGKERR